MSREIKLTGALVPLSWLVERAEQVMEQLRTSPVRIELIEYLEKLHDHLASELCRSKEFLDAGGIYKVMLEALALYSVNHTATYAILRLFPVIADHFFAVHYREVGEEFKEFCKIPQVRPE